MKAKAHGMSCISSEGKLGVWGLAPRKIFEPRLLERQKTPFCKVGYKLLSSLISMLGKESSSPNQFLSSCDD